MKDLIKIKLTNPVHFLFKIILGQFLSSSNIYDYSYAPNVNTQHQQFLQQSQKQQNLINTIASMQTNNNYLEASNGVTENQNNTMSVSLFVASCPPWSKPLLNSKTHLGHACSTWIKCPFGFTCYSNFPDGRNAHCCTTVPLDNQVVFRANTFPLSQQQMLQYEPEISTFIKENTKKKYKSFNSSILEIETTQKTTVDDLMIKCPKGTVNVDGTQCKRSMFKKSFNATCFLFKKFLRMKN